MRFKKLAKKRKNEKKIRKRRKIYYRQIYTEKR